MTASVSTQSSQRNVAISRLPANWASEHLDDITCSRAAVNGDDLLRIEITPADKVRFYGLRPTSELSISPGHTACLGLTLAAERPANIRAFLVLREWDHKGTFLYQVQKAIQLTQQLRPFAAYLTVRDPERIVQPALLFEREGSQSARVSFLIGNVSMAAA